MGLRCLPILLTFFCVEVRPSRPHEWLNNVGTGPILGETMLMKFGDHVLRAEVRGILMDPLTNEKMYVIVFEDGDIEHMTLKDVQKYIFPWRVIQPHADEETKTATPFDAGRIDPLLGATLVKKIGNDVLRGEVRGMFIDLAMPFNNVNVYTIVYEDGKVEHMTREAVEQHLFRQTVDQRDADEEAKKSAEVDKQSEDNEQMLFFGFSLRALLLSLIILACVERMPRVTTTRKYSKLRYFLRMLRDYARGHASAQSSKGPHESLSDGQNHERHGVESCDAMRLDVETLCVVCMEFPKAYAILPCGHRCLCSACAKNFKQNKPLAQKRKRFTTCALCPMCRGRADAIIQIFD